MTGATLTGEDESAFTKIHSNEFIRRSKTLYMTATPRIFAENAKNRASEKDAILTSMDDQETYGPVFFRLGFGQAVKENLLTDYKVIILTVSEEEVSQHYQAIAEMGGELNLDTAAKLTGCWNALAKRKNRGSDVDYGEDRAPMRRAVAFCKDIKASKAVATQFPDLVNGPFGLSDLSNDDASDNLQVECRHVDGTMNAAVRAQEMAWLTEGSGTDEEPVCQILTNAHCLSEGVDVPTLDAVLFLSPRTRSSRSTPTKSPYSATSRACPLTNTPHSRSLPIGCPRSAGSVKARAAVTDNLNSASTSLTDQST